MLVASASQAWPRLGRSLGAEPAVLVWGSVGSRQRPWAGALGKLTAGLLSMFIKLTEQSLHLGMESLQDG